MNERVIYKDVVAGRETTSPLVPGDGKSGGFAALGLKRQEGEDRDVTGTPRLGQCVGRSA